MASPESKEVSKAIRMAVWPQLRENGFTKFTQTTAWRYEVDRIDILNFQQMGALIARGVDSTSFSFSVNLAIYFPFIPEPPPTHKSIAKGQPPEYCGHFRSAVKSPSEFAVPSYSSLWFVSEDLSNLLEIMLEVRSRVWHYALPWFERHGDLRTAYSVALDEESYDVNGVGNPGSPHASLIAGCIAMRLDIPGAELHYSRALEFEYHEPIRQVLEDQLAEYWKRMQ